MKRIIYALILLSSLPMYTRADDVPTNRHALDSLTGLIVRLEAAQRREGASDTARLQLASALRHYAFTAERFGLSEEAQQHAQRAYELYMSAGEYKWASLCLYERCIAYNNIGDTTHVAELMAELEALTKKDSSAVTRYNYYSIQLAYLMLTPPEPSSASEPNPRRELIEQLGRQSMDALKGIDNYHQYNIMPAWTYYNHALVYDMLYFPPQTDSIAKYLLLAEESGQQSPSLTDRLEVQISVGDERAWLYYYDKDYPRAEQQMLHVLALLDSVQTDSPASIITERGEAYAFMVELYTTQQRYAEALEYQQLLTENNAKRYSIDRQRILDEVQTKYEVDKAQMTIRHQNAVIRHVVIAAALLILAAMAVLTALWYRKRETEQALYVKALEADNIYNELEQLRQSHSIEPLLVLQEGLLAQIKDATIRQRIADVNMDAFRDMLIGARDLSMMDKRYLLCFFAGISAEQIASIFNISPASVYTVRYRIGKKNAHLKGIF